jgi:hypothetical protein
MGGRRQAAHRGDPGEDEPPEGDEGADGQDPDAGSSEDDDDDAGEAGKSKTYDESYVKKLREEAAARRKNERKLEDELKAIRDKELTDKERAERDAAEATTRATEREKLANARILSAAITEAAIAANAIDAATVRDLLAGKVELDDDGEPVGVEEAVSELLKSKPFLVKSGDDTGGRAAGSGAGTGNGHAARSGKLTLAKLKTMSREEIAALPKSEVDAVLAAG